MPIIVKNRRTGREKLLTEHGQGAAILDVTSKGPDPWVKLSPFYPHGGIPVPFSPGVFSQSVEGVWQGLKVFSSADIDPSKFEITNMKGIKRSGRTLGKVLGHREGVKGTRLISYAEARRTIYLPTYRWIIENRLKSLIDDLKRLAVGKTVIFLDYETNCDLENLSKPLSHAGLVKLYVEGGWPN